MLTIEQIKNMNELEMSIYDYIMRHKEKILHMKIRELADEVHVSTTTVLRFCKKAGCNGFAEFKIKYRIYLEQHKMDRIEHDIPLMLDFFNKIDNEGFFGKINDVAHMIYESEKVIFTGIGTSGTLGQYAARTFTNYGKFAVCIEDPFYPVGKGSHHKTIVIALSVSGETQETIRHVEDFIKEDCRTIAITNMEDCTLSRMCDVTFTYYMPQQCVNEVLNVTTQVPVIFIIEALAKRLMELMEIDS